MPHRAPLPTFGELTALGREHGIEHLGVAPAGVLHRARRELHARRKAGFDAGMAFTFRNPDRSTDPARAVPGARSIIVAARSYLADNEPARPPGAQARVARYAWIDHYGPLRAGLRAIAERLRAAGERAIAFADDNAVVDREVAYLGGLGWFGKNANLLVSGAGSWFVLGSVVTTAGFDAELPEAPVADGCGSCRRCIDRCPTGAIVAPGVIDAGRCLAWVLQRPGTIPVELRQVVGDRIYGCDDCQEVCPPTVRLGRRHRRALGELEASSADGAQAWVDVLDLLDADDATLLDRHGRWYIAARDPRWLRRNALVVLGNVGDGSDERTAATLTRYRVGDDDVLAEHARWASERLGLTDEAARTTGRAAGSTA
jgi:epoxyqueuosine reductase